jgi:omega-6 fatty acid desaturase (delta-12 desaturase)
MEQKINTLPSMKELNTLLKPYSQVNWKKVTWQLVSSVLPYIGLWILMVWSYQISYWITLALAVPAGLFLVRVFIIFHDCGHNSFSPSLKFNRIVGYLTGILVFTPSEKWWHSHAVHHASSGNLDKRGVGDVMTLTVDEYQQKSWFGKLGYRLFRSPLVMFLLGPIYMFLISHRYASPKLGKKIVRWQTYHNLGLLVFGAAMSLLVGWKVFLMIQLPVIWIAGVVGIWLFFVQHQYEGVYWARSESWNYVASGLKGASYYQLPKWLQWFSGNIGFHHIHHLNPRIPNYELETCHNKNQILQTEAKQIGLFEGLRSIGLDLIDETSGKLIRFRDLRNLNIANSPQPQEP